MPCLAVDVKAAPTAGERGSFVALVSTYARDRSDEVIMPGAFAASLERWRASAKMIPVLADHEGKIENVVGHIDPRLTHETPEGLQATGVLDLSTPLGKRVYDLVKGGSLAWSIGFTMSPRARHQHGDVIELSEVDLVEVSAVPTPAAEGTRTLAVKSAEDAFQEQVAAILNPPESPAAEAKAVKPLRVAIFPC